MQAKLAMNVERRHAATRPWMATRLPSLLYAQPKRRPPHCQAKEGAVKYRLATTPEPTSNYSHLYDIIWELNDDNGFCGYIVELQSSTLRRNLFVFKEVCDASLPSEIPLRLLLRARQHFGPVPFQLLLEAWGFRVQCLISGPTGIGFRRILYYPLLPVGTLLFIQALLYGLLESRAGLPRILHLRKP